MNGKNCITLPPIAEPLLAWFAQNKRDLPWRADRLPYHVWIAEIMLQQTRIEAVKKYYARFIEALPDVRSLSLVSEDRLLKLWEGLGYYSRARNLQKAALIMMHSYGGQLPQTYEALLRLPGIGSYTAGAIASICFGERVTAVDGNVLRVLARLLGSMQNVLLPETKQMMTAALETILPDTPGDFNEALMELGELLCVPNGAPACASCPLQHLCIANKQLQTADIPVRIAKRHRRQEKKTVLLLVSPDGRIAVEKRPAKGLLSGLYQLPNLDGFHSEEEILRRLHEALPTGITFCKEAKHAFTHLDWLMRCYRVTVGQLQASYLWASPQDLAECYPLPTAFKIFVGE